MLRWSKKKTVGGPIPRKARRPHPAASCGLAFTPHTASRGLVFPRPRAASHSRSLVRPRIHPRSPEVTSYREGTGGAIILIRYWRRTSVLLLRNLLLVELKTEPPSASPRQRATAYAINCHDAACLAPTFSDSGIFAERAASRSHCRLA